MWLQELWTDARQSLRRMRQRPGVTALVLAALGVGVGACLALAVVAQSLFLKRLPYPDEQRIGVFWLDYDWTAEEFDFVRDRIRTFEAVAAFSTDGGTYSPSLRGTDETSVLTYVVASPTLFEVLGVKPAIGRAFSSDDDRPDAAPVIVVSDGLWRQDLGADPNVIGRRILLDGEPVTVIGVMPKGFFFPTPDLRAWRPLRINATSASYRNGFLTLVAKARPGASDLATRGEIRRIAAALGERFHYPEAWDKTRNSHAVPVRTYLLGDVRLPVFFLLGAVGLLFLISCANGAALVLAQTSDRAEELAVRAALGAAPARLARQIVAESLVLAVLASGVGAGCATAAFRLIVSRLPLHNGFDTTVVLGWTVPLFAFGLALFSTMVISWVPVRRLLFGRGAAVGRERSHSGLHGGAHRVHNIIIAAQVTLGMVLIVGAALLTRSVAQLRAVDLGMDPHNVATFTMVAPNTVPPVERRQWDREILERVQAMPGVVAAGTTNRLPLRDLGYQSVVRVEGRPDLDGPKEPNALYRTADGRFFRAMGMRLVEGRTFDGRDGALGPPTVIISDVFARDMWPGQSPVGKHLTDRWSGQPVSRRVVGIVHQPRLTKLTGKEPYAMWVPAEQTAQGIGGVLTVRSGRSPATLISDVRRLTAALHPQIALTRIETMEDVVASSMTEPLQLRFFLNTLGVVALALGGIGIFGVVSYGVARRKAELALRMALGATSQELSAHVFRAAMSPVAVGVVLGALGALAARGLVARLIYGISPLDTTSFLGAALTLLLSAGVAATVPMIRAANTNPADALRG